MRSPNYGVDKRVAQMFREDGCQLPQPDEGNATLVKSAKGIRAKQVLVVGTPDLWRFDYPDIRNFSRLALSTLAAQNSPVERAVMTIHGAGFGLDPVEAFDYEIAGLQNAVQSGMFPPSLVRISIVEKQSMMAKFLQHHMRVRLPNGTIERPQPAVRTIVRAIAPQSSSVAMKKAAVPKKRKAAKKKAAVSRASRTKSSDIGHKNSVFVAMPFNAPGMNDLYHYGIVGGARAAGFVCERADTTSFTGDVVKWIRHRIENAAYMLAILTGANANVYLEVGYAWGRRVPCVFFARSEEDLQFDVAGQKCIFYDDIQDLEEKLEKELKGLKKPQ